MTDSSLITFHSENIPFELENSNKVVDWICSTILTEKKFLGEISYIFCNDEYLHKMNVEYLNHDTLTDIITFNYSKGNTLSADIFISLERVKENANEFKVSFQDELHRVIIHGILHLIGYDDKTDADKTAMRSKEDFYLSLRLI